MKVIIVETGKPAEIKDIQGDLKDMQRIVGGNIEAVYPYEDEVALICNEEGKFLCELNRALTTEENEMYDIVAGTFIVVGLGEEDFCSLSPNLAKKYCNKFKDPEVFIKKGNGMMVIRVPEEQNLSDNKKEKKGNAR